MNEVVFRNVEGRVVPCQPWPQAFYVSRTMLRTDAVEVRPLTVTGLVKGVGKNFVTMNYWRFVATLRVLLNTPENCMLSWRHFNVTPWRYHMLWRLRIVRAAKRAWRWLHA
jgi:hypothetical protein